MSTRPIIHVTLVIVRMDTGGTERCLANIANGLSRDRFRVSLLCLDRAGAACDWIEKEDVQVVELHLQRGNRLRAVGLISSALAALETNVVHSHNWGTLLETYFAARRIRELVQVHGERGSLLGTDRCGPVKSRMRFLAMRWACRRINALTTNSRRVASGMCKITGVAEERIHVIPNGLDAPFTQEQLSSFRSSARSELGINGDECLIGSVGRLAPVKNFELLIGALAQVHGTGVRPHLVLVGDGTQRESLVQLTRKLNLTEHVHFVGEQANVWRFLASMDVYVNSSRSEGMSQSILEAMAAGLPCIATDVGDAAHMLSNTSPCGIVVGPNDIAGLVNGLLALQSVDVRQRFSKNALERQRKEYGMTSMISAYERLYKTAVHCSPAA